MEAVFFPRNDYPNNVEICTHRFGKSMTYTEQSDGLQNQGNASDIDLPNVNYTYQWIVPYAKSKNVKLGYFAAIGSPINDAGGVKSDLKGGYIWLDAYSLTPNLQDYIIPGYAHYGEPITQELWNAAYNEYVYPNFVGFTGKKPIALSYSYGTDTFSQYITQFLAGRNSGKSTYPNYKTDYGAGFGNPSNIFYSFTDFKSRISTTRWYDTENSKTTPDFTTAIAAQSELIDETKLNGGWLNNFTHFHNVKRDGHKQVYEDYIDMLASKNVNDDIYFAGYGEAVAYLVYRQLITKVAMYSPISHPNTKLVIRLEAINTLGVDTDLLQVPISVKLSTTGTPLEGYTIISNCNLITLGNDKYIIEIPYSRFPLAVIEKVID